MHTLISIRFCGLIHLFLFTFLLDLSAAEVETLPKQRAPTFSVMEETCPEEKTECVIEYFNKVTKDLCDHEIITVNPSYWKESRKMQALPEYREVMCPPDELIVNQIRFMQGSASGEFTGLKHDVLELAHDLQSGKVKLTDLPKIMVWQDQQGRIWTIDHRRLIALLLSGTSKNVPVIFADKETVIKKSFEFTTTNQGKKIHMWLTDHVALVIGNDNRCAEECN